MIYSTIVPPFWNVLDHPVNITFLGLGDPIVSLSVEHWLVDTPRVPVLL